MNQKQPTPKLSPFDKKVISYQKENAATLKRLKIDMIPVLTHPERISSWLELVAVRFLTGRGYITAISYQPKAKK